jgi:hypothetical protein
MRNLDQEKVGLSELNGKVLERIVLGDFELKKGSEPLQGLNKDFIENLCSMIEQLMSDSDFISDRELGTSSKYSKKAIIEFLRSNYDNPVIIKKFISRIEENIKKIEKDLYRAIENINKGIEMSKESSPKASDEKLMILRKMNSFWGKIKTISLNLYTLMRIFKEMSKLQEAEPVRNLFSINLINSLKRGLEKKNIKVNRMVYVTTLSDNEGYITWPDFLGVDAFIDYEVEIDGVKKKGIIYMDGTKDPKKVPTGEVLGLGTMEDKLKIPFTNLKDEPTLQSLGSTTAGYILDKNLFTL